MEAQTDLITAILYSVSGALILAITGMIIHAYNRILKTQDAFLEALSAIKVEQAEQFMLIDANKDHIVRVERILESQSDEMADKIVMKLRAMSGSNHTGKK